MFKPGDRVRRKKEHRSSELWTQHIKDSILVVEHCTPVLVHFTEESWKTRHENRHHWDTDKFELAYSSKRLVRR